MHRKAVFALAGLFLAVALVAPPVILLIQADQDLDNLIVVQDNPALATSGNITIAQETSERHQANFLIIIIIEVVFVILFAVTMYYGISHTHPETLTASQQFAPN
jgi:nicotinamide riboside transporter PnuC